MERHPSVAWIGGQLVPFEQAVVPVEDRGLEFGESLYEVVAVTAGKARVLAEHAARMRRGAAYIGIERGVPSDDEWLAIFEALQKNESIEEGILYAQVTGGTAPRAHLSPAEPTFFAYLRQVRFPRAEQAAAGIRVVTLEDIRWARRDVKTTMLLPAVLAKREAARRGASEALFVSHDGEVHEGSSSNVFIVEGKTPVTPLQSQRLLPGLTRLLVERVAAPAGFSIRSEVISRERLMAADEVFITSTTNLVMPVTHVDDHPIGRGTAGPVALELARRLRDWCELS